MNTKQLFVATALAAIAAAAAAAPAQATEHNARVAEYLLQHSDARYHPNARVAEYRLLQHQDARYHPNARVAEYLLQHRHN